MQADLPLIALSSAGRAAEGSESTLLAAPVAACMVLLLSIYRSVCRQN